MLRQALETLDNLFPAAEVVRPLRVLLERHAEANLVRIEMEERACGYVMVPADCELQVLTRAFYHCLYGPSLADVVVLVALGGMVPGMPPAPIYCYATLHLTADKLLRSVDFHVELR